MNVNNMTNTTKPIMVTVSGSFHRHMQEIQEAVDTLKDHGATVLSPSEPRVVDNFGDFLFVASDLRRSIRGVQNRHLSAIRHSSFVWLECQGGYIGSSAAFEVGYAMAVRVPVYSSVPPNDLTMRQYVQVMSGPLEALQLMRHQTHQQSKAAELSFLLDPIEAAALAQEEIERLKAEHLSNWQVEGDPTEDRIGKLIDIFAIPAA